MYGRCRVNIPYNGASGYVSFKQRDDQNGLQLREHPTTWRPKNPTGLVLTPIHGTLRSCVPEL